MDKKPTIIVVDDDEILLDVLEKSLTMTGFSCKTFNSAEKALDHLVQAPCDMVITDIMMPGMKGLELTSRVKQLRSNMGVIVMTGFNDEFSYDQAIDAGATDFIKKPFVMQELLVRVKHVIRQEKMRELSITDELTGLLNRRGFIAIAQQQIKVSHRSKGKLALLFADMDELKSINDRLGHHKGDEALIAMADILRETFRESDIIARLSGDEFAVLLLDTSESYCRSIFSRLQGNIDGYNIHLGGRITLAISIGMAFYDHDHPCLIDELLKQADKRMYAQKQLKKNTGQVRYCHDTETSPYDSHLPESEQKV